MYWIHSRQRVEAPASARICSVVQARVARRPDLVGVGRGAGRGGGPEGREEQSQERSFFLRPLGLTASDFYLEVLSGLLCANSNHRRGAPSKRHRQLEPTLTQPSRSRATRVHGLSRLVRSFKLRKTQLPVGETTRTFFAPTTPTPNSLLSLFYLRTYSQFLKTTGN